jgi:hypothetical protein
MLFPTICVCYVYVVYSDVCSTRHVARFIQDTCIFRGGSWLENTLSNPLSQPYWSPPFRCKSSMEPLLCLRQVVCFVVYYITGFVDCFCLCVWCVRVVNYVLFTCCFVPIWFANWCVVLSGLVYPVPPVVFPLCREHSPRVCGRSGRTAYS